MFAIAIIGQKGGTGKTTTALGLAVEAARAGDGVMVLDLDPQANAANWKDRRTDANPGVVSVQVSRLRLTVEAAQGEADLVIIDTPGRSESAAIEAARLADLVLIPSHPRIFDLETLAGIRDLLRIAGDPLAFVLLNGMHPSATTSADQAKALTEQTSGMRVCPVHLSRFDIHFEAQALGKVAQEIQPHGQPAQELQRLYGFVCQQLDTAKGEHGKGHERVAKRS